LKVEKRWENRGAEYRVLKIAVEIAIYMKDEFSIVGDIVLVLFSFGA
jgi:hypothetical protein